MDDKVQEFWTWWNGSGAEQLAKMFREEIPQDEAVFAELTDRVQAIAPGLTFEFSSGESSEFVLTVTSEGVAEFRGPARRWLDSAPAPDATWAYSDLRLPKDDFGILMGDLDVQSSDLRFTIEPGQSVLNIGMYHPVFEQLSEDTQPSLAQLGFVLLDSVLGERNVELWVGQIDWLQHPGPELLVSDAKAAVAQLESRFPVDGEGNWVVFESHQDEEHYVARVRPPLKPLADPHKDIHVRIEVPCVENELDELYELEDRLMDVQGARLVAVETLAGVRTFHLYTSGEHIESLHGLTQEHSGEAVVDPGWVRVSHLHF